MVKVTRELPERVYGDQTIATSWLDLPADGRCFLAILKGDKDQAGNRIDKNREDPEERMVLVTVTESSLLTIE